MTEEQASKANVDSVTPFVEAADRIFRRGDRESGMCFRESPKRSLVAWAHLVKQELDENRRARLVCS
jgi:hypothetical protein